MEALQKALMCSRLAATAGTEASDRSIPTDLVVSQTVNNTSLVDIVGAHFHFYHIARGDFDEVLPQLT